MEISLFLAKFWGLFMLTMGVSLLYDKKNLDRLFKAAEDENFLLITGFIALILGLISVLLHNIWAVSWVGLITLFGWLSLLKGAVRLISPSTMSEMIKTYKKSVYLKHTVYILLGIGVYLTYVGFTF